MARILKGMPLSVGAGLKAFAKIKKEYLSDEVSELLKSDTEVKNEYAVIELGVLSDIAYKTNREITANYLPGSRNPVGFNTGKRITIGQILFKTFDRDAISYITNNLKFIGKDDKGDRTVSGESPTFNYGANSFVNKALYEQEALIAEKAELKTEHLCYMDELPIMDIHIVGIADSVQSLTLDNDTTTDKFKKNQTYQLILHGVKFRSDNFGISAGAPLADQQFDVYIVKGVTPWKECE